MYQTRRSLIYLMTIILVIVLPTAIALGWYQFTRDPNLRPLGITREALRDFGAPGVGVDLIAYVDWPVSQATSPAKRQLAGDLLASFASKGVEARLVFRDTDGPAKVTYVIGKSVIGPYPASRAAGGIAAAVEAYRMY
ncbi:MAG: hypothetical protein R3D59_04935 [Paracoccaceae bacterium]|nr:hypothetical protein [Maritimibacter sp.]